jgi:hypothetical protein
MDCRPSVFRWITVFALSAVLTLGGATAAAAQGAEQQGRKSPPLALALSVLVPGAGQVYNGDYLKGGIMFGGAVITAGPLILTASDVLGLDDDRSGTGTHVLGAVGVGLILWSWIDAPLSAKAINRRLDSGRLTLEIGPRVEINRSGRGMDLRLLRIGL